MSPRRTVESSNLQQKPIYIYVKSEDVGCTKEADRRKWDEKMKFDWMVRSIAN